MKKIIFYIFLVLSAIHPAVFADGTDIKLGVGLNVNQTKTNDPGLGGKVDLQAKERSPYPHRKDADVDVKASASFASDGSAAVEYGANLGILLNDEMDLVIDLLRVRATPLSSYIPGGVIFPGLGISYRSQHSRTSLVGHPFMFHKINSNGFSQAGFFGLEDRDLPIAQALELRTEYNFDDVVELAASLEGVLVYNRDKDSKSRISGDCSSADDLLPCELPSVVEKSPGFEQVGLGLNTRAAGAVTVNLGEDAFIKLEGVAEKMDLKGVETHLDGTKGKEASISDTNYSANLIVGYEVK